jgi:hypothetical protein
MKKLIIVLLIICGVKGVAQNSTTYIIESLTPPSKLLDQRPSIDAFKFSAKQIEKSAKLPDSLVIFGEHSVQRSLFGQASSPLVCNKGRGDVINRL